MKASPNVVILHADQLRAQALGYAGDVNARTPNIDLLAKQSANFRNAITCCPLCGPARASLLTGRYPLSHGVIVNDIHLGNDAPSIAHAFLGAGYTTAYIGKWHVDGSGSRSAFIPPERRQGFEFWNVLECTHDYFHSKYWGNDDTMHQWKGYDAIAQSRAAQEYIRARAKDPKPFFLMVSWGPPHDPYQAVPWRFKRRFPARRIVLRPNVPEHARRKARETLAGYHAHVSALDESCGGILQAIKEAGIEDDTMIVFTSDHGDMLGSQGLWGKQCPWDESIRIPLLIKNPGFRGKFARSIDYPINIPDVMPTILTMCNILVPKTVEGHDLSNPTIYQDPNEDQAVMFSSYSPICNWHEVGKEYRGIRTARYTYVRSLGGPWLLYDNDVDPYQLNNRVDDISFLGVRKKLDALLQVKLGEMKDRFLPGNDYLARFGYPTGPDGAVPYRT